MTYDEVVDYLRRLELHTAIKLLEEQERDIAAQSLSFISRLGSLLRGQCVENDNRRLAKLLSTATLKCRNACPEDIDYRRHRGIDPSKINSLLTLDFLSRGHSLIITGATGSGKTWLACAFGNQCARKGYSVKFWRLIHLLEELTNARNRGTIRRLRKRISKIHLLIIDEWGASTMTDDDRREILEIVDDREDRGGLLITSQRPVDQWHAYIGEPNIADAILDRIIHSSHRIVLDGTESMRKLLAPTLTTTGA